MNGWEEILSNKFGNPSTKSDIQHAMSGWVNSLEEILRTSIYIVVISFKTIDF